MNREWVEGRALALAERGWKADKVGRRTIYGHPAFAGHVFSFHADHGWRHRAYAMDVAYGYGLKSLRKHLNKFHLGDSLNEELREFYGLTVGEFVEVPERVINKARGLVAAGLADVVEGPRSSFYPIAVRDDARGDWRAFMLCFEGDGGKPVASRRLREKDSDEPIPYAL